MKIDCILPGGFFLSLEILKILWEPHEEYLLESFTFSPFVGLCNHAENLRISELLACRVLSHRQPGCGGGRHQCQGVLIAWRGCGFWRKPWGTSVTNWTFNQLLLGFLLTPACVQPSLFCGNRQYSGPGPCPCRVPSRLFVFSKQFQ